MTKQPSIQQNLRQQISQLDELGNEQLNDLLERLELQKKKLPPEDHPIIDWGISVIQAKTLEKNQLIREMCQELEETYCSYSDFKTKSHWEKLDLTQEYDEKTWKESITPLLDKIADSTYLCGRPEWAERYAQKFREYSSIFCKEFDREILHTKMVDGCIAYCNRRIEEIQKSSDIDDRQLLADCYKNLIQGIRN